MRDTITCPSCHARLRLPEEKPAGGMTCPRCLAEVPYQAAPPLETAPLQAPPPTAIQPERAEPPTLAHCPSCGRRVEPDWIFCPHCEEPLRQDRGRRGNRVDVDVKRAGKGVSVSLVLLAVLGAIGIFMFFASAVGSGRDLGAFLGGVVILLLVTLICTAIMFYRTRHDPSKRGVGRVVLSTLATIGAFMAIGCSASLAVFVFAFVVCLAGGMRF